MVTTEPSAVAPVPSTAIPLSLNAITAPYVVGLSVVVGVSVVVQQAFLLWLVHPLQ